MDYKLKLVGKIDLSPRPNNDSFSLSNQKGNGFRLLSMSVSFGSLKTVSFDFGVLLDEGYSDYRFFSLLIGNNGVGKSSLLREIVDFFIDANNGKNTRSKSNLNITSLSYELDNVKYRIDKDRNLFKYYKNELIVKRSEVIVPLIIATTSGMFDKFPIKKKTTNDKEDRYNVSFYKYVGPKVNNNMFMSKTNQMLQHLSAMNTIRHKNQLTRIAKLLNVIGYEAELAISYKVKNIDDPNLKSKSYNISSECKNFLGRLSPEHIQDGKILFKSSTLDEVRQMHLSEIYELRQNNLLSSFKCFFFRDNKSIDCNNLSSGEFNMLSIVMSVILSTEDSNALILLDEPEISQHPNWQRDMIYILDDALVDNNCHFLIATHSHLLVSNLPMNRSSVIHMEKHEDSVKISPIEATTYGWSPEEVLLKVFMMTTDRNKYLAEMLGSFIKEISENNISIDDAHNKLAFLNKVSEGMSEVDPIKMIIKTITEEFRRNGRY